MESLLFSFKLLFISLNPLVAFRIVLSAVRSGQLGRAGGKGVDSLAHVEDWEAPQTESEGS